MSKSGKHFGNASAYTCNVFCGIRELKQRRQRRQGRRQIKNEVKFYQ